MIAANSVQPCWFQFGRQPGRDRVFSEGKPSNAISLATAIFTGFAAVICNNADAREPQCPLPSFSTLCFRFSSHSGLLARFWARFRPNRILIKELAEDGTKI